MPGATPEQVYDLLPTIAESMPLDHPLQAAVHAPDPQAALRELDIDHFGELESDVLRSGKIKMDDELDAGVADKALAGGPEVLIVDSPEDGNGKGLGDESDLDGPDADLVRVVDDPETPEIEVAIVEPDEDHGFDGPDIDAEAGAAMWGKALDG